MKPDRPRDGTQSSRAGTPVADGSNTRPGRRATGFQRSQRKTGMIGPQNDRATALPSI
jgi:hypothetical protein